MPIRPPSKGRGSGATPAELARISAVESKNTQLENRVTGVMDSAASLEQRVSVNEALDVDQQQRLNFIEGRVGEEAAKVTDIQDALPKKADLGVDGKIPLAQLPEIPVGRKITVANTAARLALNIYPDITIAYEADTADVWALESNEDPSVAANWTKLGNSDASGVVSFNGRTSNVLPLAGDYSADMITETTAKQFVSESNKDSWNAKETLAGSQAKADAVKNYADAAFVKRGDIAAPMGVAPLNAQGIVPLVNLPEMGASEAEVARILAVENKNASQDEEINNVKIKNSAQDILINGVIQKNAEQELLINNIQATKADLVNGRVPLSQLPDLPVGRKLSVANEAARLALPVHPDITIAYQLDTGGAWVLDANENPSIQSNWDILGNAQASGVATWNGRAGNVAPQSGDYITNQISETVDKMFLTPAKEAKWDGYQTSINIVSSVANTANNKADAATSNITTLTNRVGAVETSAASKITQATADTRYLQKTDRAVANGVAPLNASNIVPSNFLPSHLPQTKRIWREVKGGRVVGSYYTNNSNNELEIFVRHKPTTSTTRYTQIVVRESAASQWFNFTTTQSSAVGTTDCVSATVPTGWQYAVTTNGGTTIDLIESWYELY